MDYKKELIYNRLNNLIDFFESSNNTYILKELQLLKKDIDNKFKN